MTKHNTAVTFAPAAYQAWLDVPTPDGLATTRTTVEVLATAYERDGGEEGWLLEAALDALRTTDLPAGLPAPWTFGPGVTDLQVWTIAEPDGAGGRVTGAVTVDGVQLSLGELTEADLIPGEQPMLPGYDAAQAALTSLADRANTVADGLRRRAGAAGQLTPEQISLALAALAELWRYERINRSSQLLTPQQREVAELVLSAVDAAAGPIRC